MHADKSFTEEMKVGAKLCAIIQDKDAREQLVSDPAHVLAEAGVNTEVTLLADTADTVHLIIPATVDSTRVEAGDESYFEELGRLALGSCVYRELPE
ncbi:MAG: hypothetical protein JJ979_04330 [Roseibium sp.]|nr:hypothetical protein [Roseibium sp.]